MSEYLGNLLLKDLLEGVSSVAFEPRHEKTCLRVSDQVRHRSACSSTEASLSLQILDIETRGIILYRKWTTKVLIRLRGCAGWSAPLLFAYGISRFFHDVAELQHVLLMNRLNKTEPGILCDLLASEGSFQNLFTFSMKKLWVLCYPRRSQCGLWSDSAGWWEFLLSRSVIL